MYQLYLEGSREDRHLLIPGTVSDEEWKDKIAVSEKRYQEFKKKIKIGELPKVKVVAARKKEKSSCPQG